MQDNDTSKEARQKRILSAMREDPQAVLREALKAESAQEPPAGEGTEPSDEALWDAYQRTQQGEGEPQRQQADDEGTDEPTDDALWDAYERSWKGDDS